jgi:hypothetical protein
MKIFNNSFEIANIILKILLMYDLIVNENHTKDESGQNLNLRIRVMEKWIPFVMLFYSKAFSHFQKFLKQLHALNLF